MVVRFLLFIAACLVASSATAQPKCGGVQMPAKQSIAETALSLNGQGIRRATILNVHVYVAGLYVEQKSRKPAEVLQPARSKLLRLQFVRDVSRKEMLDAMHEGLEKNAGARLAVAKQHMQSFERYLPDLHKGMILSLAYRPGHGLEVRADGKLLGSENNDDFANLVFRVWLGDHPPDDDLKAGLLGGACD